MSSRARIGGAAWLGLGALLLLAGMVAQVFFRRDGGARVQTVALLRETNGPAGPLVPVFVTLSTNDARFIRRWFETGTNVGVFTLTNSQSCPIWLSPFAYLEEEGHTPNHHEQSLVLDAPTFSGVYLLPGKAAIVELALPPRKGRQRVMFEYTRDSCHDSLVNNLRMLPRVWRAHMNGTSVQMDTFSFFSDWISP